MTMNNTEFKLAVIEAIDKTVAQGQLGRGVRGYCAYTTANYDGNEICCPVGHMMPDVDTREKADGIGGVGTLYSNDLPWVQQFSTAQVVVLKKLQYLHDDSDTKFANFKELSNERIVPLLEDLCKGRQL